jgi:hypothetical protein
MKVIYGECMASLPCVSPAPITGFEQVYDAAEKQSRMLERLAQKSLGVA